VKKLDVIAQNQNHFRNQGVEIVQKLSIFCKHRNQCRLVLSLENAGGTLGRQQEFSLIVSLTDLLLNPDHKTILRVELVPTLMIDDAETKMRTEASVLFELKTSVPFCHALQICELIYVGYLFGEKPTSP
jgi:hypothetical protein